MRTFNYQIYLDNGKWIASCTEYDIAACGDTVEDARYELQRLLVGRIAAALHEGLKDPFESVHRVESQIELGQAESITEVQLRAGWTLYLEASISDAP